MEISDATDDATPCPEDGCDKMLDLRGPGTTEGKRTFNKLYWMCPEHGYEGLVEEPLKPMKTFQVAVDNQTAQKLTALASMVAALTQRVAVLEAGRATAAPALPAAVVGQKRQRIVVGGGPEPRVVYDDEIEADISASQKSPQPPPYIRGGPDFHATGVLGRTGAGGRGTQRQ